MCLPPRELGKHRISHRRFVEAPTRPDEIVRRRVATNAVDDHRRRKELDEIDQRAHVFGPLHEPHFAAGDLIGEWRVLHAVQIVNLNGVEAKSADLARRCQHVVMQFARQAQDHMRTNFEPTAAAALDRVDHGVVMVAAVHPVERAVVHCLHAVFDGEIRAPSEFGQQVQYIVRHAVGPRANHQAYDLRMRERFFIHAPQPFHRRVRIGSRLKIRQEVAALAISQPHPRDALIDLPTDASTW